MGAAGTLYSNRAEAMNASGTSFSIRAEAMITTGWLNGLTNGRLIKLFRMFRQFLQNPKVRKGGAGKSWMTTMDDLIEEVAEIGSMMTKNDGGEV